MKNFIVSFEQLSQVFVFFSLDTKKELFDLHGIDVAKSHFSTFYWKKLFLLINGLFDRLQIFIEFFHLRKKETQKK